MGKVSELAAEYIVLSVVIALLDSISAQNGLFSMRVVRRPCYEIDLAKETLQEH